MSSLSLLIFPWCRLNLCCLQLESGLHSTLREMLQRRSLGSFLKQWLVIKPRFWTWTWTFEGRLLAFSYLSCMAGYWRRAKRSKWAQEDQARYKYINVGTACKDAIVFFVFFVLQTNVKNYWLVRFNELLNLSFWLVSDLSFTSIGVFSYLHSTTQINQGIISNYF